MIKEKLEHNGFVYLTETDLSKDMFNLSLSHSNEQPEYLYKYYSLNSNSIGALRSGFLFSSHPYQLNDKYDCSSDLIDYSTCKLDFFIQKLKVEYGVFDEDFIRHKFNSDRKWELERAVSNLERDKLFKKFGVISLTENPDDILMWSYYSLNSGFALKFKTTELKSEWYGPFPINYVNSLERINYSKFSPVMSLFYQANIKVDKWKHENEWRYLTFNPNGNYHPYYIPNDVCSRFEFYNKDSIKQIILGYDFIAPNVIQRTPEYDVVKLRNKMNNHKLIRSLLNIITSRQIPCARIVRDTRDFRLVQEDVEIIKLSANRFKINTL